MSKILLYQLKFHLQLISATRQLTFTSNLVKGQTKILLRVWSTRSNSLSCFLAHEKEVHWTSTRSLISMLVKKRPVRVLIRSLVFKLMKKRSPGPEKKTHKGLFFNLRLRKASKPLRERV